MGNDARSIWILLLALAGVALIWAWATGRAATLWAALSGVAKSTPAGGSSAVSQATSGSNPSPAIAPSNIPSYVASPLATQAESYTQTTPSSIASLLTSQTGLIAANGYSAVPSISSLLTLPSYVSTAAATASGATTPAGTGTSFFDNLFGSGFIPVFGGDSYQENTLNESPVTSGAGAFTPVATSAPALMQLTATPTLP